MHKSVLLQETIDCLNIKKGDTVVDATLGAGGHSKEIINRFGSEVRLVGMDADREALARAKRRIGEAPNFSAIVSNFRNLDKALSELGLEKADRFIFDLGLSSDQLESSGRGFSFRKDEPLSMTFSDSPQELTAKEIVNEWSEDTLASIIGGYGEEKRAKHIAKAIIEARKESAIESSSSLASIIEDVIPRRGKIHPATRTFQAIRMAVNDEVNALEEGLSKAFSALNEGGRIAVISFHSIEDRVVKNFFKEKARLGEVKIITKKPVVPTRDEVGENPRSRSAKLRVIEKIK